MLDFTAIDFETANAYRGSPCSVGLVRVRDGQIVETRHWLIRPPEGADWFDTWNVAIHGITADMVASVPRWKEVLPLIVDFVGDDVLVAHNAAFDTGVMRYACEADKIDWPEFRFLCTLVMSRHALALPTYRLPYVAESLGVVLEDHHDALADAIAVVEILVKLADRQEVNELIALADSIGVRFGTMGGGAYRGSSKVRSSGGGSSGRGFAPIEVNSDADPGGYLYGRVVVFTGALDSMTRDVARQECAKVGAFPEENTTKRTNVLVVGNINPGSLRPGAKLTGKTRKAFELQDKGQPIEVMTEDDFLRCLDGNTLGGVEVLLQEGDQSEVSAKPKNNDVPPVTIKPPRPLRRKPVPTGQLCSIEGCGMTAAFKTRSKPTWCAEHISDKQREGGLRPLEDFTHPDDYQLTECLVCGVEAHYRFTYTLEKNKSHEPTCRACFWRRWAKDARRMLGEWADLIPVQYDEARAHAEKYGFDYLGPLSAPSYSEDPHHVRCRRCGKVTVGRLSDIGFGCTCIPKT